jgi:Kef-type K+ transport system membrane component KefB
VVFAVVIAQRFPQAVAIFIPISNLATADGIENACILIFAYFFVVTSWIGYFRSTKNKPHRETKLGTVRFGIDLLIIYLFYYLVTLVQKKDQHGDIFLWALPIILGIFLLWDLVKYLEYRNEVEEPNEERFNRIVITLVFLAAIIIQSFLYSLALPYIQPLPFGENVVNVLFTATSVTITFLYRLRKWKDPRRTRRARVDG